MQKKQKEAKKSLSKTCAENLETLDFIEFFGSQLYTKYRQGDIMAMSYKDKLVWLDSNHAALKDNPKVKLIFAEKAEEGIVDKVLGMLMKPTTNEK